MNGAKLLRTISLPLALLLIGGSIYYLESQKPGLPAELIPATTPRPMKLFNRNYSTKPAPEIVSPAGFINTDGIALNDLVGQSVILVDFWTYSCINCQRTLPYLNAWHDKYHEQGLVILGVHTPEFAFEKKLENVQAAVTKYGIKYPVILDNDYATWHAYRNRYWPRKYLIDLDGNIVYDHIGEGAYEETERKIQELLAQRAARLRTQAAIPTSVADATPVPSTVEGRSPEIYFGSARNRHLGNGQPGQSGQQQLVLTAEPKLNQLYLTGTWQFEPEYAAPVTPGATVVFRYQAQDVYLVAGAAQAATLTIKRDGKALGPAAGEDVTEQEGKSEITISTNRLYKLIHDTAAGEHTLEITAQEPGVQLFTFTFG